MKKNVFWGILTLAYGMSAFASDGLDGEITLIGQVVESTCLVDRDHGELRDDCQSAAQRFASAHQQTQQPGISTTRFFLANDTQRQIILNTYD